MGIHIDGRAIGEVYHGSDQIREVYHGSDLVWSSSPETLDFDFQWEQARTRGWPIMFLGSSTTAGFGTTRHEGFTNQLIAAITKQAVGAPAHRPVTQNSGTVSSGSTVRTGFHFLNAGVGGTRTQTYYGNDRHNLMMSFTPRIVVHTIGSNDYAGQVPLAEVKANVGAVVDRIDNSQPPGSTPRQHLFIHSYRREDRADTGITWEQYGQAIREVCDERDNAHFLDAGAWFDHLKQDGVTYLQSDQVHATWQGNELLAKAVAAGLGFDDHDGDMIYGIDATSWPHLDDGTLMSSFTPVDGSLAEVQMRGTGNQRPALRDRDGVRSLDFTGGQKRMETVGWSGAHSLPVTFYVVTSSMGNSGDNLQPFFTRSVAADDGYLWAWRERDSNLLKAASNSAFNNGVNLPNPGSPKIMAVTFLASGHVRYYHNSVAGTLINPDRATETNSPWMRSLKIGTNTGNSAFTEMDVREMYWHHGDNETTVQTRVTELADKHSIQIISEITDWVEVTESQVLDAPDNAAYVDIVALGAGAGGGSAGGAPGKWNFTTWTMTPGRSLDITIGQGGSGSTGGNSGGGDTTIIPNNIDWRVTGEGGQGAGGTGGVGAPGYTVFNQRFEGSPDANAVGQDGGVPGGGGGRMQGSSPGGDGGRGTVWYRWHLYNR